MTLVTFCRSVATLLFMTVKAVSVTLFLVFDYDALWLTFMAAGTSQRKVSLVVEGYGSHPFVGVYVCRAGKRYPGKQY